MEHTTLTLAESMRDSIVRLLQSPNQNPDTLGRWLEGYGLPPHDESEEPFRIVLMGYGLLDFNQVDRLAFPSYVKELLDVHPDSTPYGEEPEAFLANLLLLCAGISEPEVLFSSLFAMYVRGTLAGSWHGIPLGHCLFVALAQNQRDNTLEQSWLAVVSGQSQMPLVGDAYDALDAVILMPPSYADRGHPATRAIGDALAELAKQLEAHVDDREQPKEQFRRLLARAQEAYPGYEWDREWIAIADNYGWPAWAVEALPSLFVKNSAEGGLAQYLVWKRAFSLISNKAPKLRIVRTYCKGDVALVEGPADSFLKVAPFMRMAEAERRAMPFRGPTAATSILQSVVLQCEYSPNALAKLDADYRQMRRRLRMPCEA